MEAIAKTKHLKGSPRKARLVIDMIRGVNVSRALAILKFTDKRAADPIAKTLLSAIANATFKAEKQNIAIDPDDLYVKACFVDMGAHKNRRRMRPAPQGRAYREQRHYCHITIEVSSDKPAVEEGKKRNAKVSAATEEETKKSTSKRAATKKTDAGEKTAKASAKKSDEVKKGKATAEEADVEEVETTTATTATEQTVEETTTPAIATEEATEETSPKATEASKAVSEEETKGDAEAADAKDTATQQPEELNETKRADDKQEDVNEQLERQ